MIDDLIVQAVFPQLAATRVQSLDVRDGTLEISAVTACASAPCPVCGAMSTRVHGGYARRLRDLPVGGQHVEICLRARRFVCGNPGCRRRTFSAQVEGLTCRYGRFSLPLQQMLTQVAVFLAGRPGARLAARLAAPASRSTLLRLLDAVPLPVAGAVSEVGIDDFAVRRGHHYATLVIDMGTHRPVDVLPDRTSETTKAWLEDHPGIVVICRDRAGAYAEAGRLGAPDAVQVADRWHLWHNLAEAVEKVVRRHRQALDPPIPTREEAADPTAPQADPSDEPALAAAPVDPGRLVTRSIERHAAVHALIGAGRSLSAVSRELGLDIKTVRRFARAATIEDLWPDTRLRRDSVLDAFKAHLHQRWNEGVTDAAALTREITALGYAGSEKTVRRYLHPLRAAGLPAPPPVPTPPTVRQVTGWLTRRPEDVPDADAATLAVITGRCPALAGTHDLVRDFAKMLTHLGGAHLPEWMDSVEQDGEPELRAFAAGLRRDIDAVTAGLTMSHSSGPVEGNVNRVKTIKRQMYGRANLDLLRRRVLLAA